VRLEGSQDGGYENLMWLHVQMRAIWGWSR